MFKNRNIFVLVVCAVLLLTLYPMTADASSLLERLRARRAGAPPTDLPPQPITSPEGPVIMEPVAPPTPGTTPPTQPTSQPTAHGAQPAGPGPAAPTAPTTAGPRAIPRATPSQPAATPTHAPVAGQPAQPGQPAHHHAAQPTQPTAQPAQPVPRASGAPTAASRLAERVSSSVNVPRTYGGETLPEVAGLTDTPQAGAHPHTMEPPAHLRDPATQPPSAYPGAHPGAPAAHPGVPAAAMDPHHAGHPSHEHAHHTSQPSVTPFPADFTPRENTIYRRLPNGRLVMTDISPQGESIRQQSARV